MEITCKFAKAKTILTEPHTHGVKVILTIKNKRCVFANWVHDIHMSLSFCIPFKSEIDCISSIASLKPSNRLENDA